MISLSELYALSLIDGVGDQTLRKLITQQLTIADLQHDAASLKRILHNSKSQELFKEQFDSFLEETEKQISKFSRGGIEVIHCLSEAYPSNLLLLEDFPLFLFCRGNLKLLKSENNVAVIGTRDNSTVGARIAKATAFHFAANGYTIVSGLAKGIDGIAHQAALDAKGKTIAVLIDVLKIYPAENKQLAADILKQDGLLIAETKPGTYQGKNAFVLRDRIQSGLSLAIFPIETDIKGGTMHTVGYARKQKRLTYVPNLNNKAIKEWYELSVGPSFSKINGIRELINSGQAVPYSKEDFSEIAVALEARSIELKKTRNYIDWIVNTTKAKESNLGSATENSSIPIYSKEHPHKDEKAVEVHVEPTLQSNFLMQNTRAVLVNLKEKEIENESETLNKELLLLNKKDAEIESEIKKANAIVKQLKKEKKAIDKQREIISLKINQSKEEKEDSEVQKNGLLFKML